MERKQLCRTYLCREAVWNILTILLRSFHFGSQFFHLFSPVCWLTYPYGSLIYGLWTRQFQNSTICNELESDYLGSVIVTYGKYVSGVPDQTLRHGLLVLPEFITCLFVRFFTMWNHRVVEDEHFFRNAIQIFRAILSAVKYIIVPLVSCYSIIWYIYKYCVKY